MNEPVNPKKMYSIFFELFFETSKLINLGDDRLKTYFFKQCERIIDDIGKLCVTGSSSLGIDILIRAFLERHILIKALCRPNKRDKIEKKIINWMELQRYKNLNSYNEQFNSFTDELKNEHIRLTENDESLSKEYKKNINRWDKLSTFFKKADKPNGDLSFIGLCKQLGENDLEHSYRLLSGLAHGSIEIKDTIYLDHCTAWCIDMMNLLVNQPSKKLGDKLNQLDETRVQLLDKND